MYSGSLVALATPVNEDGTLDEASLERLIEHVLAGGVSGVCPAGSTGEGPHLSRPMRMRLLEAVLRIVDGRVPVIPAVTTPVATEARADLDGYTRLGASAALVAPPFYYPLSPAGASSFFASLAADAGIPILIYNIPQFTKVVLSPALIAKLAEEPKITGIKDSSRDFEFYTSVVAATLGRPEFCVLTGSDTMLLASLLVGGHGTIAGTVNLVPQLVTDVFTTTRRGDLGAALDLQRRLLKVTEATRVGYFPAGLKAALHLAGLCQPFTVHPNQRLGEADTASLREAMAGAGVELAAQPVS